VKVADELRPYLQALTEPVEQGLWLRFTAERLGVAEADLRQGLAQTGPPPARRWQAGRGLAINREKGLLRWVLTHPETVPPAELAEWGEEFEDPELKELLRLIAAQLSQHGALDVSLLLDRLEEENRKQELCALVLGEGKSAQLPADEAFDDWCRTFRQPPLKRARQALKEKLARDNADVLTLQKQIMEIDRQLEELKAPSLTKGENG
jgi:hypothetical protein